MKLLRALIVDPEDQVRRRTAELLGDHGFDSIEAADGISALQFASPDGIDLIISDFGLPWLEGLPFLDIIKRGAFGWAPPPLIFCSAMLQGEVRIRKLAEDGIPLLVRPFTPHAFELAWVRHFLWTERICATSRGFVPSHARQCKASNRQLHPDSIRSALANLFNDRIANRALSRRSSFGTVSVQLSDYACRAATRYIHPRIGQRRFGGVRQRDVCAPRRLRD